MADDNKEFKILVSSEADTTGFKQQGESAEELKLKLARLNEEMRLATAQGVSANGLDEEIARTKKSLAAAIKEQVIPAVEEENISHREQRKILYEIGNTAAPGAGHALSELAYGPIGAALALVGVFEQLKKSLEDDEKEIENLADLASKPVNGGAELLVKSWDAATKSMAEYYAALRTAGAVSDPEEAELKRIKARTEAQIEASKRIIEELGKEEVAAIRRNDAIAGKSKEATGEDVSRAEAQTRAQLDALDDAKARAGGSDQLEREQKDRLANRNRLLREANEDAEKADAARLASDKNEDLIKSAREALDPKTDAGKALKKRLEDAAAKQAEMAQLPDTETHVSEFGVVSQTSNVEAKKAAAEEVANAQAEVDRQKKILEQVQKNARSLETAADAAEEKEKRKRAEAVRNEARLKELPGEINDAQGNEAIAEHTKQVAAILNTHGGKLNESLGQLSAETGKTGQQTLNIVGLLIQGQLTLQQAFSTLEAQLKQRDSAYPRTQG